MSSGPRWLLIVAIILLGLGEMGWVAYRAVVRVQAEMHAAMLPHPVNRVPLKGLPRHLFTRVEANTFLDRAKKAEAIADPLKRCLAYPDPPGSHWSADAVNAYCHYRFQSVITFAEVQKLIQDGKAAEVDRRFAEILQAQLTEPAARGRLDRAFYQDFNNGSFAIRSTLDAWKRDSPNSAFAWAASGYAYVQMAVDARGAQYMRDTPQSNIDAMDKLLAQADTDLRHALALDPRLTPVYTAMITAGGFGLGDEYARDAAKRGLAVAPDNNDIRDQLIWLDEPKWYGSLAEMRAQAQKAQAYAKANPLLRMLLTNEPFYRVENCDCAKLTQVAEFPAALDQLAGSGQLLIAGNAAHGVNHPASVIYLSEALRFNPGLDDARINRVHELVEFDELSWAVTEASHMIAALPHDEDPLKARAHAYDIQGDFVRAEQDYRAAVKLVPGDFESWARLGNLYVYQSHDWDKGWAVADKLIKAHPENPYGWMLRADIQAQAPRPGLKDTVAYFDAHFGNRNPQLHGIAVRMHSALVLENHSGAKVLASQGKSTAREAAARKTAVPTQ